MAKKDSEYKAIQMLLKKCGGRELRHTQRGKERKVVVSLPDDRSTYLYAFANGRQDRIAVYRRDFVRAINRQRDMRNLPRITP
jgi:hypothetical protein